MIWTLTKLGIAIALVLLGMTMTTIGDTTRAGEIGHDTP